MKEFSMKCPKCEGLMFLERLSDFFLTFYAWKCVNCGAIMDRTILNNRRKSNIFINELASLSSKEES
jgi:uncharacterized Zn finger protein